MNIERLWKETGAPLVAEVYGPAVKGGGPFSGPRGLALDDLISDFVARRTDPNSPLHKNRDDIVDFCAEAPTFKAAIGRACDSIRPNGKCHNHQSRVPRAQRDILKRKLWDDTRWLLKSKGVNPYGFEAVLQRIEGYEVASIGPVTAYDVATRIGAWLEVEPSGVHMHAGCLAGFKALQGSDSKHGRRMQAAFPAGTLRVGYLVTPDNLPKPMRHRLKLDEVEDFLCVYRQVLGRVVG